MFFIFDYSRIKQEVLNASAQSFGITSSYFKHLITNNFEEFVDIAPLTNFISDRALTVIFLVQHDKLWDAEIILRTALETFIKALYILSQRNKEDYNTKLDEFWVVLAEIERLTLSEKAKSIIKNDRLKDITSFKELILTEEEENEIKLKPSWSNRKYRVALKNDWSFSGILSYLSKDEKTPPLISFELLQYYYKSSSHIAHGDKDGINMIRGNESREDGLQDLQQTTHYIKFFKVINEMISWLTVELAIHVGNQEMIDKAMAEYRKYSKYINSVSNPLMANLNEATGKTLNNV